MIGLIIFSFLDYMAYRSGKSTDDVVGEGHILLDLALSYALAV